MVEQDQYEEITLGSIVFGNAKPFVLLAGMNVLESRELAHEVAGALAEICQALSIAWVFKASFDKANRSSVSSFRGPGMKQGLAWLAEIKQRYQVPIITDVHEPFQAHPVAEVADILQIPAFLSRQTDLVQAIARTGAVVNIKKAQFLAPTDMLNILQKFRAYGNNRLLLCERGTCFGYHNLIVDMLGFGVMKRLQVPLIFDVTHALQLPTAQKSSAGGRREQIVALARSGLSQGIAGLFLELHPKPEEALCDGPCALRLQQLQPFLAQMKALDALVKSFPELDTA